VIARLPENSQAWFEMMDSTITAAHFSVDRLYVGFEGAERFSHLADILGKCMQLLQTAPHKNFTNLAV